MSDATPRLKTALLVDSPMIATWQMSAIQHCLDKIEISAVFHCTNSRAARRFFKHGFYYLLNFVSIRNRQTKSVSWKTLVSDPKNETRFECLNSGNWQEFDDKTRELIARGKFDLVIKFGMNLLRDPQKCEAKYGILSFHHGDPRSFRGRPSGFYELLNNCDEISVVVQRLSNLLDGGTFFSFGSYRLHRHSYRKTLEYIFEHSAILLRKAIENCQNGSPIDLSPTGRNYKLPSNHVVLMFVVRLLVQKVKRLNFGLFLRRNWRIAPVENLDLGRLYGKVQVELLSNSPTPSGLSFVADPNILSNGKIVCEATRKNSVKGFLAILEDSSYTPLDTSLLGPQRHLSFPFSFEEKGKTYLLPEMESYGAQALLEFDEKFEVAKIHRLPGLESERLIDPVMFCRGNCWYLFAGKKGTENDQLFLWTSQDLFGEYSPHPKNPIVINPKCARNAGALLEVGDELFRVGQNNCRDYGNGITVSRISRLDREAFDEAEIGTMIVAGKNGPHTFTTANNQTVIDYYETVFDLFAWWGRAKSILKRR